MVDLAAALHLSPSGLTRRLDGLTAAGIVDRVPSLQDRRVMLAVLTDSGFAKLTEAYPDPPRQRPPTHLRSLLVRRRGCPRPGVRGHPGGPVLLIALTRRPSGAYVANLGVKDDRDDFVVIAADRPVAAAGVFTRSRFAAPCVVASRANLDRPTAQAIVVVSRNANVANGRAGEEDNLAVTDAVAARLGCRVADVLRRVDRRDRPALSDRADAQGHRRDAGTAPGRVGRPAPLAAMMTTDTRPKIAERMIDGSAARVVGIAKGAGMIEPNMATMIAVLLTDADVAGEALAATFGDVVERTFNCVSIDTDTSTSDTAVVLASGAAGPVDADAFAAALHDVALSLAKQIAGDGEGAETLIEVRVDGARDRAQAKRVAKSIVNSPLVKTAVHGADPNWGRVAMAIGKCDGDEDRDIDPDAVVIRFGDQEVYPDRPRRRPARRALRLPPPPRGADPRHARHRQRIVHRLGLRPHRRLRPHQRRLHDLTRPECFALPAVPRRRVSHPWLTRGLELGRLRYLRRACCRGATRSPDASTSWSSTASCCAATRSVIRTSGRCGCTCRRATTTPTAGTRRSTCSRATPATSRCGATARRSASRSPKSPTSRSPPARSRRASSSTSTPGPPYGGSQFVDSPGTGRYHSYLCDEVVPFVDERYRTLAAPQHRGVVRQVERRVRRVHHADAAPRPVRRAGQPRRRLALRVPATSPSSPRSCARSATSYDGSYERFWEDFRSRPPMSQEDDDHLVMTYGCAACFSADDDGTRDAAVRPRHRRADPRALGPLAGVGSGADGAALRRRAARPAGDLHRRRHPGPVVPRPRRQGDGRALAADRRHRRLLRAVRRHAHGDRLPLPHWPASTSPNACRDGVRPTLRRIVTAMCRFRRYLGGIGSRRRRGSSRR